MKIGIAGLGKVGLPVALALAVKGKHEVTGYDPCPDRPSRVLAGIDPPWCEEMMPEMLAMDHQIALASSPAELVRSSDLLITAVQTPHEPQYDGTVPVPDVKRDFDYLWLSQSVNELTEAAQEQRKHVTLAVMSTVLPGTMRRLIPNKSDYVSFVYSPAFISLGSVIPDFLAPKFVLAGVRRSSDAGKLVTAYDALHSAPLSVVSFETAEVAKMAYNMFGTVKITFANMLMELCHKTGSDVDEVTDLIEAAGSYMKGGMPDGGPCRPRDLIALSWLARKHDLSADLPDMIGRARETQTAWLAGLVRQYEQKTGMRAVILGRSYKPGSDLDAGSPSLLLAHYLGAEIREPDETDGKPAVFVTAVRFPGMAWRQFPRGSVVIDPWGVVRDQGGVTVVRVGRP